MDDEAVFGPVFHRLSFGEAIERDLLSDYQVVVVGVDDATYREWAERGEFVTRDGEHEDHRCPHAGRSDRPGQDDAQVRPAPDHLLPLARQGGARVRAEMPEVIAWMPARARPTGALWTDHVSGAMTAVTATSGCATSPTRRRGARPAQQRPLPGRGRRRADHRRRGVHRPAPLRIDIVQALGRAIRKAPDKTVGTIVIPVFIDTDQDPETALDDSAFKHVWDVMKALAPTTRHSARNSTSCGGRSAGAAGG